jgi:hypothetical protein
LTLILQNKTDGNNSDCSNSCIKAFRTLFPKLNTLFLFSQRVKDQTMYVNAKVISTDEQIPVIATTKHQMKYYDK